MNWEDDRVKFSLEEVHRDFWLKLIEFYKAFRDTMINQQIAQLTSHEWVGLYKSMEDALPYWIICTGCLKEHKPGLIQFSAKFMNTFPKSFVGSQCYILTNIKQNTKNAISPMDFAGWMTHDRVDSRT
jgi:hypothetical protein